MVLYVVRRERPLQVRLFSLKLRPRQVNDVFVASLKECRLDSKLVAINARHPFVSVCFGGSDVRTDMTIVSWNVPDCSVRNVCQVNCCVAAIVILPGNEKYEVLIRNTQVAGIKAPHLFEIAAPDGQHLDVGRGMDIEEVNGAALCNLN